MSDDYLSARLPPDNRRNSNVHFADELTIPAHLARRRSDVGGRDNVSDGSAYASGVNRYPSQPSAYSSENGISRQPSADIADQHVYDMDEPQRRPSWQRGLSFDSTQHDRNYSEKRRSGEGKENRRISLSRAASLDSVYSYYARRPPTLRYGKQDDNVHEGHDQPEHPDHANSFLGRVNGAFHRAIRDPVLSVANAHLGGSEGNRQNSFARYNDRCIGNDDLDNFERAQCINEDFDDTYLIDEEEHNGLRLRRHPQERMGPPESVRTYSDFDPTKRRTYHQRRQKDRHTIKYHAESRFFLLSSSLCPKLVFQAWKNTTSSYLFSLKPFLLLAHLPIVSKRSSTLYPKFSNLRPNSSIPPVWCKSPLATRS